MAAHYRVHADPPFTLLVGRHSRALAELYTRYGIDCCAYLTACNPHSRLLSVAENAKRQAVLDHILRRRGIRVIEGAGCDPDGQWPDEASLLAPGLDRNTACRIGARFGQNAIVFCGPSATPELLWLAIDPPHPA